MIRNVVLTTPDYTVRDQERMPLACNYFDWQRRMTLPHMGRKVLEIGCGVGNFTKHLLDRERVLGIDFVGECVAAHQVNLGAHPHVSALGMDVLDHRFLELEKFHPDSIVCLNVLEHVGDDIQALRHMCAVLPERGNVVLIVPASESQIALFDSRIVPFLEPLEKFVKPPFGQSLFAVLVKGQA